MINLEASKGRVLLPELFYQLDPSRAEGEKPAAGLGEVFGGLSLLQSAQALDQVGGTVRRRQSVL